MQANVRFSPNAINDDLLRLVHLSNGFRMVDGVPDVASSWRCLSKEKAEGEMKVRMSFEISFMRLTLMFRYR
jgi:hypothetical protein